MRVYTPEALPRLLASFQPLDATLARAWAHIAAPAATAAERVQQLISQRQILDEEDRRPGASLPSPAAAIAGGGGAKTAAASAGWVAPVSFSRGSVCFVDAHRIALRRWLESPIVSGAACISHNASQRCSSDRRAAQRAPRAAAASRLLRAARGSPRVNRQAGPACRAVPRVPRHRAPARAFRSAQQRTAASRVCRHEAAGARRKVLVVSARARSVMAYGI